MLPIFAYLGEMAVSAVATVAVEELFDKYFNDEKKKKNLPVPIGKRKKNLPVLYKKKNLPVPVKKDKKIKNVNYNDKLVAGATVLTGLYSQMSNLYFQKQSEVKSRVESSIKEVQSTFSNGDTLLDVLKNNSTVLNKNILTLIGVLSGIHITFEKYVNYMMTRDIVNPVMNFDVLSSEVSNLSEVLAQKFTTLSSLSNLDKLDKLNKLEDISNNSLRLKETLNDKLSNIDEYHRFLNTETSISDLDGNPLANVSPAMINAINNAVQARLNTDENSLTGEDLEDFENDFDLGDVLVELFNFKGISDDVKKLGGNNGS